MSRDRPLTDNKEEQQRAEEFADRMEAEMRLLGSSGDYFCEGQRSRWRQHAIRAYLGLSPEHDEQSLSGHIRTNPIKPPQPA
jgi:hypothetical protein